MTVYSKLFVSLRIKFVQSCIQVLFEINYCLAHLSGALAMEEPSKTAD